MLDDSIQSQRQKNILQILKKSEKLSRDQISRFLGKISKPTLVRDLKTLLEKGLIFSEGKAKATKYFLPNKGSLFEYIDIDGYFKKKLNERAIKTSFDWDIFKKLKNLFTKEEIKKWKDSSKEFKKRSRILDKTIFKREIERFIVEFAWKSSQIEGNTYDLLETETLLRENIEAEGHSRQEAIMLLNHKDAIKTILANKESFKSISFADVMQLHRTLTKDLITSGIRTRPVGISGTNYVPMSDKNDLEKALKKTVRLIEKIEFPPEKAFIASFMIAYIQPFTDGNKRTSRTLSNAILIANNFFPLSYRDINLNEYRKAMVIFYEQNNIFYFKNMFMEQLDFAINNYFRI